MKTGIVVFAHGSSIASANEAVRSLTAVVAQAGQFELVETAFLELASPDLEEAVTRLRERGAERIIVVPYFLTLGIHLQRDLPRLVEGLREQHPGVEIAVADPLDGHPALAQIVVERAQKALANAGAAG
ncbi:MAG: CbiX/SirB N-terminal domain-containing protein [Bryobacteraceae bacterium]|nr:CbiX/SirB N-terminal domain-containing protein [Bryobacteraceae bacterium]